MRKRRAQNVNEYVHADVLRKELEGARFDTHHAHAYLSRGCAAFVNDGRKETVELQHSIRVSNCIDHFVPSHV